MRAVALAAVLVAAGCDGRPGATPPAAPPAAAAAAPSAAGPVRPPLPAGRAVPDGEPEAVAALERFLQPPAQRRPCGPYRLLSDLPPPRLVGIERFCATLAAALEEEVAARFGVVPAHPPRGTIVLFASRRRYRDAVAAAGDLPQGYAAWSDARAGTVALAAGDVSDDELAATLAHELTHLAERRLFGFPRPRWLAEGLADAIGDSATPAGFRKLEGFVGVEAQRRRWLAMSQGRAGALERLVADGPEPFDHGPASLDYELAALFVRFLLLDPELAPRFRSWLGDQTVQRPTIPALFPALGVDAPTLERRFESWVTAGPTSWRTAPPPAGAAMAHSATALARSANDLAACTA